ncbi:MAG: aldehyde dehydrogenase family protein [Ectothiorhodospiraceae bacterium]|nr:aldehyde dehydrogenase family protein [Ectothiorhodospiraceae bacterium]
MKAIERIYIDGQWHAVDGPRLEVHDSATGQVMASIPGAGAAEVDQAVKAARRAFASWSRTPVQERKAYLAAMLEQLKNRSGEIAETVSREVGMPIKLSGMIQAGMPQVTTGNYVKLLDEFPFTEEVGNSVIQHAPVGVVGAITPWNYPLHQIMLKVAPALAAGCTVVLKPSEIAPLTAFILAEICEAIELPPGVVNVVSGVGQDVGEALINHPQVNMISFTGSTRTGHRIAHAAAEDFKRLALEMGGKSASIILSDADLEAAVKGTINNCYLNSGQTCTALTRMLVPAELHDQACEIAAAVAAKFAPGNPLEETTRLGPLASSMQRDKVREYIRIGQEEGAKLVAGGAEAPEGLDQGYFVKATVFGNVDPASRIGQEEIFGPVLSIMSYRDEDDAVEIANGTPYGLSGAVWSDDRDRALDVAGRMRTGQVFVNNGKFNPWAPFGGFGHSGLGREAGKFGLEEFLEPRAIQL